MSNSRKTSDGLNWLDMARRRFLAGAAVGGVSSVFASPALAQQTAPTTVARSADKLHRNEINRIKRLLDGKALFSKQAFYALIDDLVEKKLVPGDAGQILKDLVDLLLSESSLRDILGKVRATFDSLKDEVGGVVIAVVGVLKDSLDYVIEFLGRVEKKRLVEIVAHDLQGALGGAAAGAATGALFGPTGAVIGAVVGVLAGGGSTSAIEIVKGA